MSIIDALPPIEERGPVSAEQFEREVVNVYAPVVLRGQVAGWPAVAAAGEGRAAIARYVAGFDAGRPAEVMLGPPEIAGRYFYSDDMRGFNFTRQHVPVTAIVSELLRLADDPAPPAIYAGAATAADHLPGWVEANPIGLPMPDATPRVWLGNATRVSTHYDMSPNLAAVVAGERRFLLFPPNQLANLYVGPLDRTLAGQPVSMVDPDAPDLDRYPRFAEALRHARVARLRPGDAIYIPSLWWHNVQATAPFNVLVNYWWRQPPHASPFAAMVHAMMTVRDLPAGERAALRTWFDHYVFADDAPDAADHLPPHGRGIVGGEGAGWREHIRRYLLRGLGG